MSADELTIPSDLHAPPVDVAISHFVRRQHGAVTFKQLRSLGLDRTAIQYRVEAGRLHRVHDGVYFVGYIPTTPLPRYMAATLSAGGVLSYHSATALWGLWDHRRIPDVTTTKQSRGDKSLHRHWTRSLDASRDTTTRHGIPVTNLKRTLVDMADVLDNDPFEALLRRAEAKSKIDRKQLTPIHGRRGAAKIARAHQLTRSGAETAFRKAIRAAKLPTPEYNARWRGFEIDALWLDQRLAVEIDGYEYHRSRAAFRQDRRKGNALTAAGHRLLRFTFDDVVDEPARCTAEVRRLLN